MDDLTKQYAKFPYPHPDASKVEEFGNLGSVLLMGCPSGFSRFYWPKANERSPQNILSAGCGTTQAVALALRNPVAKITGIDQSRESLEIASSFAKEYRLKNLSLIEQDIIQHSGKYDFIMCTGVLHHTIDPLAYLRHLGELLKPHGCLLIQVYGESNRLELRSFKRAIRILGATASNTGLDFVKSLIPRLPAYHPAVLSKNKYTDLTNDSGIVDFFLNPREVEYSVRNLIEMCFDANLQFYSWSEPWHYDLDFYLDGEIKRRASRFDHIERWSIAESFSYPLTMHSVVLKKMQNHSLAFSGRHPDATHIEWRPGIKINCDPKGAEIIFSPHKNIFIPGLTQDEAELIRSGCPIDKIELFGKNKYVLNKLIELGILFCYEP